MKKKMTKMEVKELLRRIIEFEVGRAFTKNMEGIKKDKLDKGKVEEIIKRWLNNCDYVTEDDMGDRVQNEITNMDLVDEDRVNDIVSDEIGNVIDDKIGSIETVAEDLGIKTDRMDKDISDNEDKISDLDNRLEKIEYEIKNLANQIKKGV